MSRTVPTVKGVQSADGTASLTFQYTSSSPDLRGEVFLFTAAQENQTIEVNVLIKTTTAAPARKHFALSKGATDLWSLPPDKDLLRLPLMKRLEYIGKYAETFGDTFFVKEFQVNKKLNQKELENLRDVFCELWFEYRSSYKYNNSDPDVDDNRRYLDTIYFEPDDIDRALYAAIPAIKGGSHD